jgi:sugar lactone lactonase YvrE
MAVVLCSLLPIHGKAQSLQLQAHPGRIDFTGAFQRGLITLEGSFGVEGPWTPLSNQFTTQSTGAFPLIHPTTHSFYRTVARELNGGLDEFENILAAYGVLGRVAGAGGLAADVNKWLPEFEGGPAIDALLSNPHMAMADLAGNIYIADKQGHAIRKVTLDGIISTVAGTGTIGDGKDGDAAGTSVDLREPNGLYVLQDGTVYVLDTGNSKVRKLTPNGRLRTLFSVSSGLGGGRGLWVSDDERLAYMSATDRVKVWTPDKGIKTFSSNFAELGNLTVDPNGQVVVTDRSASRVYRLDAEGNPTLIAGNGLGTGGGDGFLATETGLLEVRGVCFLPTGSYFLATHRGSQIWYVDTDGVIHLFLNGARRSFPRGDGSYFYAPEELRVSEVRAVTLDWQGNLIITENDSGYVRKVSFLPYIEAAPSLR